MNFKLATAGQTAAPALNQSKGQVRTPAAQDYSWQKNRIMISWSQEDIDWLVHETYTSRMDTVRPQTA
jgi:hypothetical protein